MSVRILIGDALERLKELPDASVDSCVTDPPYHLTSIVKRFGKSHLDVKPGKDLSKVMAPAFKRLSRGFMGQTWDGGDVAFRAETWAEVLRVLKPGAHLVAFSGTRTYHRMACAIEDAGFEIRDQLAWVYGSGFPKSHNQAGGWGTALKPAWEPIAFARKPLVGTVAGNMALHGTGAINIDGCRIETPDDLNGGAYSAERKPSESAWVKHGGTIHNSTGKVYQQPPGRWPANIIHDGSDEVLAAFPTVGSGTPSGIKAGGSKNCYGDFAGGIPVTGYGDEGSAARFFYCAKAAADERGDGNNHPTVKPLDLMRWLCRLVTPAGGTVLDLFSGSGSTLVAADMEQFNAIGCELSPEYAAIAERRVRSSGGMFAEVIAA